MMPSSKYAAIALFVFSAICLCICATILPKCRSKHHWHAIREYLARKRGDHRLAENIKHEGEEKLQREREAAAESAEKVIQQYAEEHALDEKSADVEASKERGDGKYEKSDDVATRHEKHVSLDL